MGFHQVSFDGKAVPGARGEAIITTINAIADGSTHFNGNGALEFDGEVGNAKPGIQLEGCRDGLSGASGDAAGALAAMIGLRSVRFQFEMGDDFGQEKPIAQFSADQVGVLSGKPQSRALCQVAFQKGTGIDIP